MWSLSLSKCGRQFVINPTNKTVSDETKQLIDKLLLERISLRVIARVTGVSWSWLQNYVNSSAISRSERVATALSITCPLIAENPCYP